MKDDCFVYQLGESSTGFVLPVALAPGVRREICNFLFFVI
jgi:hypothetical protein